MAAQHEDAHREDELSAWDEGYAAGQAAQKAQADTQSEKLVLSPGSWTQGTGELLKPRQDVRPAQPGWRHRG